MKAFFLARKSSLMFKLLRAVKQDSLRQERMYTKIFKNLPSMLDLKKNYFKLFTVVQSVVALRKMSSVVKYKEIGILNESLVPKYIKSLEYSKFSWFQIVTFCLFTVLIECKYDIFSVFL